QHEVRRALAHRYADALHLFRQPWQCDRDSVLDQHLSLIDVGARLEHDADGEDAVAGRLRHHVDHVIDAINLLLDWRRDSLRDDLRRRTSETGVHRYGGRSNLGKFRDRQGAKGDIANERQDDRDDAGEDRPVNEEVRKAHYGLAGARLNYRRSLWRR